MIQTASVSQWNKTWESSAERIELLYHDEFSGDDYWDKLEDLRESTLESGGQFISLDLAEPQTKSLPERLHAFLTTACWDRTVQFSLPIIFQHNPPAGLPFINRAILWQRLCDAFIVNDVPHRETVLVLENIDQASATTQQEVARLIRFHEKHAIRRLFVFTLNYYSHDQIIPELRDLIGV